MDVFNELSETYIGVGVCVFADAVVGKDDGFAFIFWQIDGVCSLVWRDHV